MNFIFEDLNDKSLFEGIIETEKPKKKRKITNYKQVNKKTIYIKDNNLEQIEKICKEKNITVSNLIDGILTNYFENLQTVEDDEIDNKKNIIVVDGKETVKNYNVKMESSTDIARMIKKLNGLINNVNYTNKEILKTISKIKIFEFYPNEKQNPVMEKVFVEIHNKQKETIKEIKENSKELELLMEIEKKTRTQVREMLKYEVERGNLRTDYYKQVKNKKGDKNDSTIKNKDKEKFSN